MIISVNGFEEAKSYPIMFNSSELLMDNNRDVFYIKSVDAMGKYTINTYSFKQVENEQPAMVTQEQFNSLQSKLDTLIASLGGARNAQQYTEQSAIPNTPTVNAATQPNNAPTISTVPTTFKGNPKQMVMNMLTNGQITDPQLQQAIQYARQFQNMFK